MDIIHSKTFSTIEMELWDQQHVSESYTKAKSVKADCVAVVF